MNTGEAIDGVTRQRGIVERHAGRYGTLRDLQHWRRFFVHHSDVQGLAIPESGTFVTFAPNYDADPRGPRAVDVVIEAPAWPTIVQVCVECAGSFDVTGPTQVWYRSRNWFPPRRCDGCQQARKAHPPAGPARVVEP